jgi:hypothetical protein
MRTALLERGCITCETVLTTDAFIDNTVDTET